MSRERSSQLAHKLACDALNGDTPPKERQHMIDQFQAREIRAPVCTYGAGGVGITLTAAQTVLLVDRPGHPAIVFRQKTGFIAFLRLEQ